MEPYQTTVSPQAPSEPKLQPPLPQRARLWTEMTKWELTESIHLQFPHHSEDALRKRLQKLGWTPTSDMSSSGSRKPETILEDQPSPSLQTPGQNLNIQTSGSKSRTISLT
ncbi:hypothetical protein QQF64_033805 [Cirrhinus molitorella]|uniref:Clr5 domain-containing protein n=1 Tax=Cirrhinus molitorella TaxID=172907 RepID=A0ABR3MUZ3_9TELE